MNNRTTAEFERLVKIMDDLRAGCPWDMKQTNDSLRILTIEEVYELGDAILNADDQGIKEEIGDIMLHMVFYAKIASEKGAFELADALHHVNEKLISRHPHIYGDVKVNDEEDVKRNWEMLKLKEGKKSVLGGVPQSLPAMVKAYRMQEKTAKVGFEWDETAQVWDKVKEEIGELEEAVQLGDPSKMEEEFGDVLFALVNYARFIKVDPEAALERINQKFKRRFEYIEDHADKALNDMGLQAMDDLWNEAKRKGL